jgi:20S proteasome alpha/beta subunit
MTTIIGIQGEDYAVLCADSRISMVDADGNASLSITIASTQSKICQLGRYMIGVAGDLRAINILQYGFSPPEPALNLRGNKLDTFITTKFIQALRIYLDSQGYSTTADRDGRAQQIQQGSQFIVAINATIYQIDNDYAWCTDISGMFSIGSGSTYALGALQALHKPQLSLPQAKKLALKALAVAAKYDPYTGSPYNTVVQECVSYKGK